MGVDKIHNSCFSDWLDLNTILTKSTLQIQQILLKSVLK